MIPLFNKLGLFIEKNRLWVLIAGVLLGLAAIAGASRLTMASGIETFISTNSPTYKAYQRFNQNFSGNVVVVLVTGSDTAQILDQRNLDAMGKIEAQAAASPSVLVASSPAPFLRQAQAQDPGASVQSLVIDPQTGQVRPSFRSSFPDATHALVAVVLKGNLTGHEQTQAIMDIKQWVAGAGFAGPSTVVTGEPVLFVEMQNMMTSSIRDMFILAIALMLVILAVVFAVRGFFTWRWLSLGVVILGVIYAFGAMGVLGVPITIASMAVFPVLIGLGVDYGIQFHNRYDEEVRRGETASRGALLAIAHIGPAIGIAIVAGCLGFMALFFSPVPMIRDFGMMLIIGVVACYLVALFYLATTLYWRDRRKPSRADPIGPDGHSAGFVERGLKRMGGWVVSHPAIILPIAILLTAGGMVADSHIKTETDEAKFMSPNLPFMKDLNTLQQLAGGVSSANILVEAKDVTDPAVLSWLVDLKKRIEQNEAASVVGATSVADVVLQANGGQMPSSSAQVKQVLAQMPVSIRTNLLTSDYTAANFIVTLKQSNLEQTRQLNKDLSTEIRVPPPGGSATLTGGTVVGVELFTALTSGRVKMTLIGIGFIFAGLLVLFRLNIFRAFAATLPIGLILGWSSGVMFLLGIKYTPITATLGALILGIGTEFTVLLMMRYYEERKKGEPPSEAMVTAISKIGRAIIASGMTVVGGFAALLAARSFPILSDFGTVTMINVFFALVSTLVVLPSLIVLFDTWRESRKVVSSRGASSTAK